LRKQEDLVPHGGQEAKTFAFAQDDRLYLRFSPGGSASRATIDPVVVW
jgi:hypothetical protein